MKNELLPNTKEVLKECIEESRKSLPFSLTPKDLEKLLPFGSTTISDMLVKFDYPEPDPERAIPNRKIGGKRVIPRDWFLAWYYGYEVQGELSNIYQVRVG